MDQDVVGSALDALLPGGPPSLQTPLWLMDLCAPRPYLDAKWVARVQLDRAVCGVLFQHGALDEGHFAVVSTKWPNIKVLLLDAVSGLSGVRLNQWLPAIRTALAKGMSQRPPSSTAVILAGGLLSSALSVPHGAEVSADEVCSSLVQLLFEGLEPGDIVVFSEQYEPEWTALTECAAPRDGSPMSRANGSSDILPSVLRPDLFLELATFEMSQLREGCRYLRSPRFSLKTIPNGMSSGGATVQLAFERSSPSHLRTYSLVLERCSGQLDSAHIVESVKKENEGVLSLLASSIGALRKAKSSNTYAQHLNDLLSSSASNGAEGLYGRLARSIYMQILLDATTAGLSLEGEQLTFWMAYQNREIGMLPALSDDSVYPLHGYVFGPPEFDTAHHDCLTRYWLNIVLHGDFESDTFPGDAVHLLRPPSVHEWFVDHGPCADASSLQPLETLTVYVANERNRRHALLEGCNSSRRHHRMELVPYELSHEGQDWGFQLAAELSRFKGHPGIESPYDVAPWPFLPSDEGRRQPVTVDDFADETQLLKEQLESGTRPTPSMGWLRCNLYSIFLAVCLGNAMRDSDRLPEWITLYENVLSALGYTSLLTALAQARRDSLQFIAERKPEPLAALCWVAPPVLPTLIGKARALGSILIASTCLLPVVTMKQLKGLLLSTFTALRDCEDLVDSEINAARASMSDGHAKAVDAFSHEISKLANTLFLQTLLPFTSVFTLNDSLQTKGEDRWKQAAGAVDIDVSQVDNVANWLVCPTPRLLRGLSEVLYMWSASTAWRDELGLNRQMPLDEAVDTILEAGLRVGTMIRYGLNLCDVDSIASALDREAILDREVSANRSALGSVGHDGVSLQWQGTSDTRVAESLFTRMLVAALANALYHLDRDNIHLRLGINSYPDHLTFTIVNSYKLDNANRRDASLYGGTLSVIQTCSRLLNNGATMEDLIFFDKDSSDPDHLWRTSATISLTLDHKTGENIQWLRPLL